MQMAEGYPALFARRWTKPKETEEGRRPLTALNATTTHIARPFTVCERRR